MELLQNWLTARFGAAGEIYYRLALSLLVLLAVGLARHLLLALVHRRTESVSTHYH